MEYTSAGGHVLSRHYGTSRLAGELREIAACLGVYEGRRRLRVIAQMLGLRSQGRVTQLVKSCDRRLRRDRAFRERVEALRLAVA